MHAVLRGVATAHHGKGQQLWSIVTTSGASRGKNNCVSTINSTHRHACGVYRPRLPLHSCTPHAVMPPHFLHAGTRVACATPGCLSSASLTGRATRWPHSSRAAVTAPAVHAVRAPPQVSLSRRCEGDQGALLNNPVPHTFLNNPGPHTFLRFTCGFVLGARSNASWGVPRRL